MSTLPTMTEIISWYLYGQATKPDNLLDERIISRDENATSTRSVDINEFMTTGAGRYVDVGNLKAVRKFLAGEYNLTAGTYKTERFFDEIGAEQGNARQLGIYNYGLDVGSAD